MGLDCWVYASDTPVKEEEIQGVMDDGTKISHIEQRLGEDYYEVWYGRKTHDIMNFLLRGASYTSDNCVYISLDHLDIDDLKIEHTKQVISPTWFDDGEIDHFKNLIEALENVPEDKHIYFYAWY